MLGRTPPGSSLNSPKLDAVLRVLFGCFVIFLLVRLYSSIETFGNAAMYAASWITFLHICVGEFVFVHYLSARSPVQNLLDLLAAVLLTAGILAFTSPALWCAFFGGLFALASAKYMLVMRDAGDDAVKRYTREKLFIETPVVAVLTGLALILDMVPPHSFSARLIQVLLLASTTAFAVWMTAVRHAYRRVAQRSKS